ncbi:MAG TPA: FeS-binding protein [Prolixibacteraceae bacterium]|nr:FeS-binding protein [Prolixibacteraceae bacterium]HCR88917.1 FeS-binding protein [Prolixibacteraceae bacterium]HCU62987.1 FeS-binding protein [Prolixibacteraceae bacterium]
MSLSIRRSNHIQTAFVQLDTRKCKACWKCIESCPGKVIGKVSFLSHRHAIFRNANKCKGCLKCVKGCEFGAYHSTTNVIWKQ